MPHDEERVPGDRLAEELETGKHPYTRTCINECWKECCAKRPYRSDYHCGRCGIDILTTWYCPTCMHVMPPDGPDHTDPFRISISLEWPPEYGIKPRRVGFCHVCASDIDDVSIYGVHFRRFTIRARREFSHELIDFYRFEVES